MPAATAPVAESRFGALRALDRDRGGRLAAGIVDSASSSLATFAVGLAATRLLSPADLGSYALAFSGFLVAAAVPAQLVFTPAEVELLGHPERDRLRGLPATLRVGTPIAFVAAAVTSLVVALAIATVGAGSVAGPAVTLLLASFLSPVQDHLRRLLHASAASWRAAVVSAVQLAVAAASLATLVALDAPDSWVPFGALAAANAVSLAVGIALSGAWRGPRVALPGLRELCRRGRWLLVSGGSEMVAGFLAIVLIASLAGPAAAGFAEAARVLSQPLFVLAVGMAAVLGPELTLAARDGDGGRARSVRTLYFLVLGLGGAAYLLVVGVEWSVTPLVDLVPAAYEVDGLLALMVVAQTAAYLTFAWRAEALGHGLERGFARATGLGAGVQLAVAGAAGALGARAFPLGILAAAATRSIVLSRMIARASR